MSQRSGQQDHPATTRFVIQARDRAMLRSLGEARYLTAHALEWLHFAGWRQRHRRHMANQPASVAYHPSSNLYYRLRGLCACGYIRRITRSVIHGGPQFHRVADVYALTPAGADVVDTWDATPADTLCVDTARPRALQTLEHSVAIGQFYAALRAELAFRGLPFTGWQVDQQLARSYDRVPLAGTRELAPIVPDATFVLHATRYFVEIDRGTRPLRSWDAKIRAYEAYRGSALLAQRYQVATFHVLVVAPTPHRARRIAETVARLTGQAHPDYLFLEEAYVHPTTIRRGWQRITAVIPQERAAFGTRVNHATVTLAAQPLWEQ